MPKIGRSPEGKWLILEGKDILHTLETREEAIEILKGVTVVETAAPVHSLQGREVVALGPLRLNQGWVGRRCSCGLFHLYTGREVAVCERDGILLLLEDPLADVFDG